jgi:purine nucleosidase
MKIIIDTDCGVDDTYALIAALKLYNVIAITCVSGNVNCDQAVNNVGVILETTNNHNIPYYKGCYDYILSNWKPSDYKGHGDDGLGNSKLVPKILKPKVETAVNALIRLSKEHDDIHLFAIGPLTNIALACLIDSDFPNRIKKFTVMGGAHQCKGNTGMASEFNFACDPEAASICLNKFDMTNLVTWENCYKCVIPWSYFEKFESSDNLINKFLVNITQPYIQIYGKNNSGYMVCDLMAILSPLCEDTKKCTEMVCQVELMGSYSRGATVFDWLNDAEVEYKRKYNTRIIKLDMNKVYETLDILFFVNNILS